MTPRFAAVTLIASLGFAGSAEARPKTCAEELQAIDARRQKVATDLQSTTVTLRNLGGDVGKHQKELMDLWKRHGHKQMQWQQVRADLNGIARTLFATEREIRVLQARLPYARSPGEAYRIRQQLGAAQFRWRQLQMQKRRKEPTYFRLRRSLRPVWRDVRKAQRDLRRVNRQAARVWHKRNGHARRWQRTMARLRTLQSPARQKVCKQQEKQKVDVELKRAQALQKQLDALAAELKKLDQQAATTSKRAQDLLSKLPDAK